MESCFTVGVEELKSVLDTIAGTKTVHFLYNKNIIITMKITIKKNKDNKNSITNDNDSSPLQKKFSCTGTN